MRFISYAIVLSTLIITTVNLSFISNISDNVLLFFKRPFDSNIDEPDKIENAAPNIVSLKRDINKRERYVNNNDNKIWFPKLKEQQIGNKHHRIEAVLNPQRRKDDSSGDSSSSLELKDWKTEWKDHWIQKKFEAVNSPQSTGDQVNMVAARPWGVPCGDPNQHDMPWGTCMLPMECDSEYRIYRGDHFCGRTQFVCCSLQLNTYDMYQGFDVSLADSSLSPDSEEKKNRGKGSKDKKKRKRKEKRKRKRDREKRKKNIKKNIRKIINEIRKILTRSYRNGTSERKKKTKQLKRFIKELKGQYMKDRKSVKDIHESEMIKIDADLQKRLLQIKEVNQNFVGNGTFRDIVSKGMVNKKELRMLVEAYPELSSYFKTRRQLQENYPNDYLNYDVEYGLLYN